jgi:hypothetical protein
LSAAIIQGNNSVTFKEYSPGYAASKKEYGRGKKIAGTTDTILDAESSSEAKDLPGGY